jgi:hypothetical protein
VPQLPVAGGTHELLAQDDDGADFDDDSHDDAHDPRA